MTLCLYSLEKGYKLYSVGSGEWPERMGGHEDAVQS